MTLGLIFGSIYLKIGDLVTAFSHFRDYFAAHEKSPLCCYLMAQTAAAIDLDPAVALAFAAKAYKLGYRRDFTFILPLVPLICQLPSSEKFRDQQQTLIHILADRPPSPDVEVLIAQLFELMDVPSDDGADKDGATGTAQVEKVVGGGRGGDQMQTKTAELEEIGAREVVKVICYIFNLILSILNSLFAGQND